MSDIGGVLQRRTRSASAWKAQAGQPRRAGEGRNRAVPRRYVHSTGDGLLATFDGPARAVRCAQAIDHSVSGIGLRSGLVVTPVRSGFVGEDVQGIAVHVGARVAALARPSEVLVFSTVEDLVAGLGLLFEDAGVHDLREVCDRCHSSGQLTDGATVDPTEARMANTWM